MSEQLQMDTLAYSSRMLGWAPLGKLLFIIAALVANIITSSMIVPIFTLALGLCLMWYSTNMRIPLIVIIALLEAFVILIFGCGMVSISGDAGTEAIWDTNILWVHIHMTADSFNKAWLILFRGVAGMALMMAFATSTPIPHLSNALRQIRIPSEIAELVVLIYRYGFLLLERMEVMWVAAACRLGFSGFKRTMRTTASIAVGMFVQSTNMADKGQIALDCRNYRGYFPLYNAPPKTGIAWVVASVGIFAGILLLGYFTADWINMTTIFFGGSA